jgi:hypothetical protein
MSDFRNTENTHIKALTIILLMWRIGRVPISIPIYIQQDATSHMWHCLVVYNKTVPQTGSNTDNRRLYLQ